MKIRVFKKLVDNVFHVRVQTEDWSENDVSLMVKYGEPEINLGGSITYTPTCSSDSGSDSDPSDVTIKLDDVYVRIMTESPFTHKFDVRDFNCVADAQTVASVWTSGLERTIISKVSDLRSKAEFFATEEITEY